MKKTIFILTIVFMSMICTPMVKAASVVEKGGNVYIKDRKGELWEVDQAKSIGFKPDKFQYGIGRNTIKPLDDSHLKNSPRSRFDNPRVIGVTEGNNAQAYSIKKLTAHEVANTEINKKSITAAY